MGFWAASRIIRFSIMIPLLNFPAFPPEAAKNPVDFVFFSGAMF